jgi:chitin deacetylase
MCIFISRLIPGNSSADWSLTTGATTKAKVLQQLQQWINGPKSPGLIILEHELSNQSVSCFIDAYPSMGSAGWNTTSITRLVPGNDGTVGQTYWNAPNGNSNSSIYQTDILSGPSARAAISQSVESMVLSSATSTTGERAQATSVRGARTTGACRPARLYPLWGYLIVIVVTTMIGLEV